MAIPDAAIAPQPVTDDGSFEADFTPRTSFKGTIEEEGFYPVRLASMRVEDNPFEKDKRRRAWCFQVVGQEDAGELTRYTSPTTGPNLLETLNALGVAVQTGGRISVTPAELVGRQCRALITLEPGKKDPNKLFPKIQKLSPAKG